jgi:thiol-disulfide isomerase/thioredoxin
MMKFLIYLLCTSSTSYAFVGPSGSGSNPTVGSGVADIHQPSPIHPKSDMMELHSSVVLGDTDYFQPKPRWVEGPTAKPRDVKSNIQQPPKVGKVVAEQTKIQSLQEFRNYITAEHDDKQRFTVVKYYASWCKTCAKFGLKYEKLVSKHGDWIQKGERENTIHRYGSLRFASVEYNTKTLDLFQDVGVTKLPTVQIYNADGDLIAQFDSPYTGFSELSELVQGIATSYNKVHEDSKEHKKAVGTQEVIGIKSETTLEAMELSYQSRSFDEVMSSSVPSFDSQAYQVPNATKKWWKRLTFARGLLGSRAL